VYIKSLRPFSFPKSIEESMPVQTKSPLDGSIVCHGSTPQNRWVKTGNAGNGVNACSIVIPKKLLKMAVAGFGATSVLTTGLPVWLNEPGGAGDTGDAVTPTVLCAMDWE
jgi:hypothetical protein